jgi:TATA-binding protein-associated factor
MIVDEVLSRFKVKHELLLARHGAKERMEIVDRFNHDDSIRVLILTTAVGGLGLTLTGADTVIFAEHDWNPMKDLQAIDRAHRIGQTRQVCVYRLIMQDTLEEKIMNLQRFKENLAKSLIQSRETALDSATAQGMELTDLLNSF